MNTVKGGERQKSGGTTTRHGLRKGKLVITEQARRVDYAWVSGDTQKAVSMSDLYGKRLGRFSPKKTQLLKHSTGLLVNLERLTAILHTTTAVRVGGSILAEV